MLVNIYMYYFTLYYIYIGLGDQGSIPRSSHTEDLKNFT